jgi:glycosyltransferase 2 family protein
MEPAIVPFINRRSAWWFLRLTISLAILVTFVIYSDPKRIAGVIAASNPAGFFCGILIYVVALFINSVKWRLFIPAYSTWRLFRLTLSAQLYALVTPSQVGAEIYKGASMLKVGSNSASVVSSLILDRVTGLMALSLVCCAGLLFTAYPEKVPAGWFWLSVGFVCLTSMLFLVPQVIPVRWLVLTGGARALPAQRIANSIRALFVAMRNASSHPGTVLKALGLSLLYQLACVLLTMVLAQNEGVDIGFLEWCWISTIVSLIVLLPISIGGLGVREGGFLAVLSVLGIPAEKALSVSLSIFGIQCTGVVCTWVFGMVASRVGIGAAKTPQS